LGPGCDPQPGQPAGLDQEEIMAAVGNYEVVEQAFSFCAEFPYSITVDAPADKVVLGGGIEFSSDVTTLTYDGYPATDGSSWTFQIKNNTDQGGGCPYAGTAYVTCAELGAC
jgi:hypothetical protein